MRIYRRFVIVVPLVYIHWYMIIVDFELGCGLISTLGLKLL